MGMYRHLLLVLDSHDLTYTIAQAGIDPTGVTSTRLQYDLVTTNLEKLMGIPGWIGDDGEFVVYQGGDAFNMSSKVIAVASPRRGIVELF